MAKRKKTYDDDDGRVISNMNVDGMPWYMNDRVRRRMNEDTSAGDQDFSDLTKEETRALIGGAVKAGLAVGSVFFVGFGLFILFCVFVWFR